MNRYIKGAALGLAFILSSTIFCGCQNETNIADKLAIVTEISDKALSISEGEILIKETVTAEKDIEGVAQSMDIETYVRFTSGPEAPDFELERSQLITSTGDCSEYNFVKSGETLLELFDGVGDYADEAPDIYETFNIDFGVDEISEFEVIDAEKGNDCYKMTMTPEYADKYDTESDGAKFDCTSVVICYYIDSVDRFTKRTCEITFTLTVDGESQTVTRFIESKIH